MLDAIPLQGVASMNNLGGCHHATNRQRPPLVAANIGTIEHIRAGV